MANKINKWKWVSFVLIIILVGTNFIWFVKQNKEDSSQENYLLKTLMKADSELSKISIDSQKADSYYNEASFDYEDQDYKSVESNCRLARDYYFEESQGYKRVKAELISIGIEDKLVDIYLESLDLLSDISINMYEACEHFESAGRYYDKYYSDIVWDDVDYEMGSGEIEMMNEKIRDHDRNVEEYNYKLEEYRVELKTRL